MRRARRTHHYENDNEQYEMALNEDRSGVDRVTNEFTLIGRQPRNGFQAQFLEAKVEAGDTLQALALRFHCSVADIKRINKIDKDNEIHARKVVRIPVTVHSMLLGTFPAVHKSGNSSPKHTQNVDDSQRQRLEDASTVLSEKLLVASVNSAGVREAISNSKLPEGPRYEDTSHAAITSDPTSPLLADLLLDDDSAPQPRPLRGPSLSAIDWSGTDCDMSWVCLFVFILALCFVIPLVYVIYLAEHTHHNTTH